MVTIIFNSTKKIPPNSAITRDHKKTYNENKNYEMFLFVVMIMVMKSTFELLSPSNKRENILYIYFNTIFQTFIFSVCHLSLT